jgi:hypothetical protein
MAIGIDNKEEVKVSSIDKIQELMAIGIDNKEELKVSGIYNLHFSIYWFY